MTGTKSRKLWVGLCHWKNCWRTVFVDLLFCLRCFCCCLRDDIRKLYVRDTLSHESWWCEIYCTVSSSKKPSYSSESWKNCYRLWKYWMLLGCLFLSWFHYFLKDSAIGNAQGLDLHCHFFFNSSQDAFLFAATKRELKMIPGESRWSPWSWWLNPYYTINIWWTYTCHLSSQHGERGDKENL